MKRAAGLAALALLPALPVPATATDPGLAASYRYLVTPRERGGALYRASAGRLAGSLLPLGFTDTARYWAEEVCGNPPDSCRVQVRYDPAGHTLLPQDSPAGDLMTERVNTHAGSNVYDAATWQIAVMLGAARLGLRPPGAEGRAVDAAWTLADNQNRLLRDGHFGDATHPAPDMIRALTGGERFRYNGVAVTDPRAAYVFRTLPRRWLSQDPLLEDGATGALPGIVSTAGLPAGNPEYRHGLTSWTDWKPFTGENAWALLIGPLQAAWIRHVEAGGEAFVPFDALALQNALPLLGTFASMQSPTGGVYYAPSGTLANQGKLPVDPYFVAVENTLSLVAGLRLLDAQLDAVLRHQRTLAPEDRARASAARSAIAVLLDGGLDARGRRTAGLLAFLRDHAWRDGEFVQGGLADKPGERAAWVVAHGPRAVDVNTWGIAVLGPATLDAWHGFGSAWRTWQAVKRWGGHGQDGAFAGVGFSDVDGNGIGPDGRWRNGVLSAEWTAGAVTAVRELAAHYAAIPATDPRHAEALSWLPELAADERAMLAAIEGLRLDRAPRPSLAPLSAFRTLPYLYADRRAMVPFGWYANPLPSTCATTWRIMLEARFNPFAVSPRAP